MCIRDSGIPAAVVRGRVGDEVVRGPVGDLDGDQVAGARPVSQGYAVWQREMHEPVVPRAAAHPVGLGVLAAFTRRDEHLDLSLIHI